MLLWMMPLRIPRRRFWPGYDFPSIEPALRGCVALLKQKKKRGSDFVKTLYDGVHVAGLPQGLRQLAYEGISIAMSGSSSGGGFCDHVDVIDRG